MPQTTQGQCYRTWVLLAAVYLCIAHLCQTAHASHTATNEVWLIKYLHLQPREAALLAGALDDRDISAASADTDWTAAAARLIAAGPGLGSSDQEMVVNVVHILVNAEYADACLILDREWDAILRWNSSTHAADLAGALAWREPDAPMCNLDTTMFERTKRAIESGHLAIATAIVDCKEYAVSAVALCALVEWNSTTMTLLTAMLGKLNIDNLKYLYAVPWISAEMRRHLYMQILDMDSQIGSVLAAIPPPENVHAPPLEAIFEITRMFCQSKQVSPALAAAMKTIVNVFFRASPYYAITTLTRFAIALENTQLLTIVQKLPFYKPYHVAHVLYVAVRNGEWDLVGRMITLDAHGNLADAVNILDRSMIAHHIPSGMPSTLNAVDTASRNPAFKIAGIAFGRAFLAAYTGADDSVPLEDLLRVGGFWGALANVLRWAHNTFAPQFNCRKALPAVCLTATVLHGYEPLIAQPLHAVTAVVLYQMMSRRAIGQALRQYIYRALPHVSLQQWQVISGNLQVPHFLRPARSATRNSSARRARSQSRQPY